MSSDNSVQLIEAIARNTAVVLSLPSAGMVRHHKSRFLALGSDGGIWIESTPGAEPLLNELIRNRCPAGLTFRCGTQKITFTATIKNLEMNFEINQNTHVPALQIASPAQVKVVQRRNCYRVRVSEDSGVQTRMWRIPAHAHLVDRPLPSREVLADVIDISLGGLGVRLRPRLESAPKVVDGERLRIELVFGDHTLLLEGHTRSGAPPESPEEVPRLGIRFKAMDQDLESRQKGAQLARIIGDLQRDEVRRTRRASG